MKGQAETTEVFSIIGIMVILVALIPVIIPTIQEAISMFTIDSPEVVSKDLAALVSISAAAPGDIMIRYKVSSDNSYDVGISNREVAASREFNSGKQDSSDPVLVDVSGSFSDAKDFTIEKTVVNGVEKYKVDGK
ncbi:MAG: hypothetical protein COY38_03210 [Candidatus Aenigmarchaeota archaeon CG_4_10_14_0_8_um_filter_37_24]|nr:hypothetical protein [Candidatus Aenigmarchaeota archaeon]OIN87123.1 MAG: hypothetical protein AUJ50_03045 [Candidatus Aenigmarchaeota archaeon CG1_02_38_14]PIV68918.1 MAG: hypothetical protein COS07_02510 [Candidatus Aenigmarchaeota archaeon CG01_land_8_20_14_3_00_37_9]PIW41528.1 MAG: hypothetical protein COW21_01380 [Candidatus Aenigmarchaeota archaeon CG15_BIG_FIL_POST_REV_8_21_14_020_37_27]PIX51072.1 MAG: hypothetical protein COZ52_00725 [Candidatus Aenigmarchaeota archaeon CG_4_8_14_3_u